MALYRWCTKVSWIWQSFNPENTWTEGQVLTKTCTGYEYQDLPSSWWGWDKLIQSHEGCWQSWTISRPSWATYALVHQYCCTGQWNSCCWDWSSAFISKDATIQKKWQCFYVCNVSGWLCYGQLHCHDINFFWPDTSGSNPWEIEYLIVGWGWAWNCSQYLSSCWAYNYWEGWGAGWFIEWERFVWWWAYSIKVWCWWLNWWNTSYYWCQSSAFWEIAYWWWSRSTNNVWNSWWSWAWWPASAYSWNCYYWWSWCTWQWNNWWRAYLTNAWWWWWAWSAWEDWTASKWWNGWLGKCSCISWECCWYSWGWGWIHWWCGMCWWGNAQCPATTCWSWGWGTTSSSWTAWGNWLVIIRYKTSWSHIIWANWWCKYVCWDYTIHCFTSNWTFEVWTK